MDSNDDLMIIDSSDESEDGDTMCVAAKIKTVVERGAEAARGGNRQEAAATRSNSSGKDEVIELLDSDDEQTARLDSRSFMGEEKFAVAGVKACGTGLFCTCMSGQDFKCEQQYPNLQDC